MSVNPDDELPDLEFLSDLGNDPVEPVLRLTPDDLESTRPDSAVLSTSETTAPVETAEQEPELPPGERWLNSLRNHPGPGLLETFAWIGAFFILQIGMAIPTMFALLALQGQFGRNPAEMERLMKAIIEQHMAVIVGVPLLLTYLILIPSGWYRNSPGTALKLNFSLPSLAQLLVALSLVVPLGFVADSLFHIGETALTQLAGENLKGLQQGTDVREALAQLKHAPLWLLLALVAVMPAVGEEFVFRGLIGRGLINRYGLPFGIIVTSILFAMVHLYPPHVLAILPVGVVIHWVYLTSRSYWMPMLFHFANNMVAVLALKFAANQDVVQNTPLPLAVAGGVYVLIGMAVLWKLQCRYVVVHAPATDDKPETVEVIPVRGAEAPPPSLQIERRESRSPLAFWAVALSVPILAFEGYQLWLAFSGG